MPNIVLNYFIPVLFLVGAFYLGYMSLRKWAAEEFNHEEIFNWGAGFIIAGLEAILFLVNSFTPLSMRSVLLAHLLETMSYWFIVYATCLIAFHKPILRKKIRLTMWTTSLIFIITISLICDCDLTECTSIGVTGMSLLSDVRLDIFLEITHIAMAFVNMIILYPIKLLRKEYFMLWAGAAVQVISELTQVVNIIAYEYTNTALISFEWAASACMMILFMMAVYKLTKN